jgi:hypothetical protein
MFEHGSYTRNEQQDEKQSDSAHSPHHQASGSVHHHAAHSMTPVHVQFCFPGSTRELRQLELSNAASKIIALLLMPP